MYLFFFLEHLLFSIIQSIFNFLYLIIYKFNNRSYQIIKLLKNLNLAENAYLSKINKKNQNKIIVFEMFNINENIISFYLWSALFKFKGYKCFVYPIKVNRNLYNPEPYLIYKKLGFGFINWKLNYKQKKEIDNFIKFINFNKITKTKFLNLKFRGVIIGELIYDHYLRYYFKPTCSPNSQELLKIVKKALEITIFWDDYFKSNPVSCICYSHSPYLLGIPGRVAIKHKIDSLNIAGNNVFRFNKNNIYKGDQFKHSKQILLNFFKSIGKKNEKKIKKFYFKSFKDTLSGKNKNIWGSLAYNQKNTFKKINYKNKISNTKKFKILISSHDFYEGPNLWGKFLFPDFFEWLRFLDNYIKKDKNINREWFIKPHPDARRDQTHILKNLFKSNKKVNILSPKITHAQLLNNKIDFVLTARGSISYQYTYFGINTLLCSNIGLYNDFNFVVKSYSIDDYKKKLDLMEKISRKNPNIKDAVSFFMLLNIFVYNNGSELIFPDISNYIKNKKIFLSQAKSSKYNVDTFPSIKRHLTNNQLNKIFYIINNFLNNKNQLILNSMALLKNYKTKL